MADPFAPAPDAAESPGLQPVSLPPVSPPLGIRHLLLWTACSAVLLTADKLIYRELNVKLGFSLGEERFFDAARAVLSGPGVAAVLIWLARQRRGVKFPVQPGEWLLVLQGSAALLFLLGMLAWVSPLASADSGVLIFLVPTSMLTCAYLLMAWLPPLPKWWRLLMFTLAGAWGFEFLQYLSYSVKLLGRFANLLSPIVPYGNVFVYFGVASLVGLIVCLRFDSVKQIRRGWLHWTGVATLAAGLVLGLTQHVYYRYMVE